MKGRRSSGEIVRLAKYQVDRPTVDYQDEDEDEDEQDTPAPRGTPTKIGRYTMLDLLGVGGMGVVCTAYDPKLDRKVALKLLRKKAGNDSRNSTGQARLIREAQSLAKLTHPNIVTVHDVDRVDGQIYMAMEYVDGVSLDKWMLQAERSWREVVDVFVQSARGVAAAHAAGIIHRDFKPANVLIGKDGRVLVVDFGLAKSRDADDKSQGDGDSSHDPDVRVDPAELLRERGSLMDVIGTTQDTKLTQVGRTVGTPAYMAPEQFLGLEVGPHTDQFSFGVALFESLYGYLPFPDDDREELIERVTEGLVSEPPKDTAVPTWVHRVVLRTLQRRPEDRYPSINALIGALQADPAKRRRRGLLAAGGVLLTGMSVWGLAQFISDDDMCTGAADLMAEVWNDGRRDALDAAFKASSLSYAQDQWDRVEGELAKRADDWVAHHEQVCRATNVRKDQSSRLMDVRMACLERRRGEMRALVEVFMSPDDDVVQKAVAAVQSLEDSGRCTTELGGAGFDMGGPEQQRQAEEIERQLARSKAYEVSGKIQRALEVATSALGSARALDHQPTLARAAIQHARVLANRTDDFEAARIELIEAIELAAATEQPALEVLGWAKLIVVEGVKLGRPDAGIALKVPAEIALGSLQDPRVEGALFQSVGSVLSSNDDHETALQMHLEALAKYKAAHGDQHSKVASCLSNVGAQYGRLGRPDDARRYLEDAATMLERLYGPRHPVLGSAHMNLGSVLRIDRDEEGAYQHFRLAHEIFSAAYPSHHPRVLKADLGLAHIESKFDPASAEQRYEKLLGQLNDQDQPDYRMRSSIHAYLGNLRRSTANALVADGDRAAAERTFELAYQDLQAAIAALEHLEGRKTQANDLAQTHRDLCLLERDRGRTQAAIEQCRSTWQDLLAANQVDVYAVDALDNWAQLLAEQGQSDEAIETLRGGVEVVPVKLSASLRLQLADLLWKSDAERETAVSLVREVHGALRDDPDSASKLKELTRWLRKHSL